MAEMWDYILYSMNAPFGRTRVTRGWNRTFGFVRSHIFKFVGDGTRVRPNGAFIE